MAALSACTEKPVKDSIDTSAAKEQAYIRAIEGDDEEIDIEVINRGEVLVSYSDCAQCHKEDKRAKGPAFQDIAKRYPLKKVYIELLTRKVISGGSGSWGSPIMSPHPDLKEEDARAMVSYILSLED